MKLAGTDVLIPKVSRRAFVLLWYQMNSWVSTLIQDSDNHPSTYTVTRLIFWVARITTLAKYPAPGTSKTTDPTVSSSPQIQMGFVWRRDTKDSIVYHLIMSFRKLKIYSTFGSLESFPNHHESSQIDITPRPMYIQQHNNTRKNLIPNLVNSCKENIPPQRIMGHLLPGVWHTLYIYMLEWTHPPWTTWRNYFPVARHLYTKGKYFSTKISFLGSKGRMDVTYTNPWFQDN